MKDELISRDKLLKMTKNYKSELGRLKADPFVKIGIETVESFIRDMPTITPTIEERPTGEWILHGMIYYCSNCGHECGESGDNFCGNCGAKMKGEKG